MRELEIALEEKHTDHDYLGKKICQKFKKYTSVYYMTLDLGSF